ncbi:hypothetical protein OH76DRAFT_246790 [Lentinus brumalis]|uniref:Protein kinase domain-containing protein n=1 Tax=Lentinus brumalis TaxID=2498619 RepID=A0A371CLX6_9APHY|nr:hypothetical protein OH76DRAFT_246790 [Polyporus brumalis]
MSSLLWPRFFTSFDSDDSDDPDSESSGPPSLSDSESSADPSESCYSLEAYIADRDVAVPTRAFLQTLISAGSDGNTQVFRAELRIVANGRLTEQRREVVCKVAYGEHQIEILRKEADLYNTKLRNLQGRVVPFMYGCYIDDTEEGPTGVLVLQYCGVALTYELKYYALTIRYQAVIALLAIHKAGVEHNDFAERNIVVSKNGKGRPHVRIVDFGLADHDHACLVKHDTITAYAIAPAHVDFPCNELFAACMEHAHIWFPRYAHLFGNFIHVQHATSVDSLLQHCPDVPDNEEESYVREWAQRSIDEVAKMWEKRQALDANPVSI